MGNLDFLKRGEGLKTMWRVLDIREISIQQRKHNKLMDRCRPKATVQRRGKPTEAEERNLSNNWQSRQMHIIYLVLYLQVFLGKWLLEITNDRETIVSDNISTFLMLSCWAEIKRNGIQTSTVVQEVKAAPTTQVSHLSCGFSALDSAP